MEVRRIAHETLERLLDVRLAVGKEDILNDDSILIGVTGGVELPGKHWSQTEAKLSQANGAESLFCFLDARLAFPSNFVTIDDILHGIIHDEGYTAITVVFNLLCLFLKAHFIVFARN